MLQHVRQVLAGVLATAEEQRDLLTATDRDHTRREQMPVRVRIQWCCWTAAAFPHQLQDLHRRVVVVQHLPLRRLADQFVKRRLD